MTTNALRKFAEELADFGLNTLIMEWEGTYPFTKHAAISNRYAYTRNEVKSFISYCSKLGIEVIPLHQCFGHTEYILRHSRYAHLRESSTDISQICPLKAEEAHKLFSETFSDMASLHPSNYFHIGGDETMLLGHCSRCADYVKKLGKSRLFVDYMKMICEIVLDLGKRPILWADIILRYPEAVSRLPKEAIFIDWNYGWDVNEFGNINNLQRQGCEFWGAPALRSHPDNFYLTCWEKHFHNLEDFLPYAHKAGYTGIIMTAWSTSGQYGFEWDSGGEVIEMHAIRHVYPLSGFRILLAAYARALQQEEPIRPSVFVREYAQKRFGLTAYNAEKLWKVLTADPSKIMNGKTEQGKSIKTVLSRVRAAQKLMASIKPRYNRKEFEHLKLMTDIREQYLTFKEIESRVQSNNFTSKKIFNVSRELKALFKTASRLDDRFSQQNKGFLYDSEILQENMIRNQELNLLYERLTRKR